MRVLVPPGLNRGIMDTYKVFELDKVFTVRNPTAILYCNIIEECMFEKACPERIFTISSIWPRDWCAQ